MVWTAVDTPSASDELLELREEDRGDDRGERVAAAAEQRGAAEDDDGDGDQQVAVALERASAGR